MPSRVTPAVAPRHLAPQETLATKEELGKVESRNSDLSARELQLRQQESVEVPRARCVLDTRRRWGVAPRRSLGTSTTTRRHPPAPCVALL